jgi:hypothetical protein
MSKACLPLRTFWASGVRCALYAAGQAATNRVRVITKGYHEMCE